MDLPVIAINNLSFTYENRTNPTLDHVNLNVDELDTTLNARTARGYKARAAHHLGSVLIRICDLLENEVHHSLDSSLAWRKGLSRLQLTATEFKCTSRIRDGKAA